MVPSLRLLLLTLAALLLPFPALSQTCSPVRRRLRAHLCSQTCITGLTLLRFSSKQKPHLSRMGIRATHCMRGWACYARTSSVSSKRFRSFHTSSGSISRKTNIFRQTSASAFSP